MAVWRFALLNTLGAALWAALITAAVTGKIDVRGAA